MKLLRLLLIPLALAATAVQAQFYVNPAALPSYELGRATGPGNSYDFGTGALIVKDISGGGGGGGDASAANQVIGNGSLATIASSLPPALLNGGVAVTGTSPNIQGTAGVLNAAVELPVAGAAGAAIQVSGTWAGTLTFQSTINGTDWLTHNGTVYGGASITNISTTTANGAWAFRVAGAQRLRAIMTAYTSGTATIDIRAATSVGGTASEGLATQPVSGTVTVGSSVTPGTGATNLGKAEDAVAATGDTAVPTLLVRRDALTTDTSATGDYASPTGNRFSATYTAGFRTAMRTYSATASITAAASATDIAALFGNATTTVNITKIRITGIQTTTGTVEVLAIRRSTANTGGTSSNFSVALHDASDTANSSTPISYTANPSALGTAAGTLRRQYLPVGSAASALSGDYIFEFGDNGKPIVLSGTTQGLVLNLNGATVTGGVFTVTIEWGEF